MMDSSSSASTRPYLIRALYEWCTDNGYTPYVAVRVDSTVRVPQEFVKDGEIVLNISFDATSSLKLGNEFIEFKARFAGTPREILVPINNVLAIYSRENGQGMAFPVTYSGSDGERDLLLPEPADEPNAMKRGSDTRLKPVSVVAASEKKDPVTGDEPPKSGPRPSLKRVK